jgi:hypothetical protein
MAFGRKNGGGGAKASAPAARPMSTMPAARPAASSSMAPKPAAPPPAQHQSALPPAAAPASAGSSLMGTMGSSMAGSMVGSAVSHYMFSGSGGQGGQAVAPGGAAAPMASMAGGSPVCGMEAKSFLQCMSETNNDFSRCDHIYDMFKQCHGAS